VIPEEPSKTNNTLGDDLSQKIKLSFSDQEGSSSVRSRNKNFV
jgi:hypothetical protein